MIVHRHPEALIVDLRISEKLYQFQGNPTVLLELVGTQPDGQTIIIDEIQKDLIFFHLFTYLRVFQCERGCLSSNRLGNAAS